MDSIYCVKAISLTEKTKEKLETDFEVVKIKHAVWQEKTLDDYIEFLRGWKELDYYSDSFISSYHETFEEAENYVANNLGDINESGSYNFASISQVPIGVVYGDVIGEPVLYEYDREKDEYHKITDKTRPEYDYLMIETVGYVPFRCEEENER